MKGKPRETDAFQFFITIVYVYLNIINVDVVRLPLELGIDVFVFWTVAVATILATVESELNLVPSCIFFSSSSAISFIFVPW